MKRDRKDWQQTVAWWLPAKLVYYVLIRAWANATTGKWEKETLLNRERLRGILKSVLLINDDWAVDQAISQIKESEEK